MTLHEATTTDMIAAVTAEEARALDGARLEEWIAGLRRREEELLRELGVVRAGLRALEGEMWRRHGRASAGIHGGDHD